MNLTEKVTDLILDPDSWPNRLARYVLIAGVGGVAIMALLVFIGGK